MNDGVSSPIVATPRQDRRLRAENRGRIAWLMLRGMFGWRFAAAAVLLSIAIGGGMLFVFKNKPDMEPNEVHILLGRVMAAFVLILAAPLLPDERSGGTLEILWLACGSFRRLLRWKTFAVATAATLCIVPVVLVADWFFGGRLAGGWEIVFLITQSLLATAWMFYVGSYLPQPWAGGLVAGAVFLAVEWPLSAAGSGFNPFIQFYTGGATTVGLGTFLFSRAVILFLIWFLHDQASRRIRRWLA